MNQTKDVRSDFSYFVGRNLAKGAQLVELDVVVQFASGQQVVLDNSAVNQSGTFREYKRAIS